MFSSTIETVPALLPVTAVPACAGAWPAGACDATGAVRAPRAGRAVRPAAALARRTAAPVPAYQGTRVPFAVTVDQALKFRVHSSVVVLDDMGPRPWRPPV